MPWEKQFNPDEVLDKAMQSFWTRGYEATSMQDLVDCTGVNRASLYATFGDKHALFVAALRMYDERMCGKLLTDIEARYEPRDAIRQLFLAFVENVSESGSNRGCFVTNSALELADHDRQVGEIVANAQGQIEDFFARMIKLGKDRHVIPGHVKATDVARGLLASLIGLVVLSRSRPDKALLQTVIGEAMGRLG